MPKVRYPVSLTISRCGGMWYVAWWHVADLKSTFSDTGWFMLIFWPGCRLVWYPCCSGDFTGGLSGLVSNRSHDSVMWDSLPTTSRLQIEAKKYMREQPIWEVIRALESGQLLYILSRPKMYIIWRSRWVPAVTCSVHWHSCAVVSF